MNVLMNLQYFLLKGIDNKTKPSKPVSTPPKMTPTSLQRNRFKYPY